MNLFRLYACRLGVIPGWALVAVAASASTRVSEVEMQPFVIDHGAGLECGLDPSFLLEAPVGRDGFLTRRGDQPIKSDATPVRLWGVNSSLSNPYSAL